MRSFLEGILKKIEARAEARLAKTASDDRAARPSAPPAREDFIGDALIERGNQLEDGGEVEAALRLYKQAAEQSPHYARAQINIGNALRALDRADEARAAYERAIAIDAADERAHLNLGNLLLDEREFAAAEREYREALRLRPEWPDAWLGLGCALEEKPDVAQAERAYSEAQRLAPNDARAAHNLARMRRDLGDAAGSVAALQQALAISAGDPAIESDLLLTLNFLPGIAASELLDVHRKAGEALSARTARVQPRVSSDPQRPLRIGFVSADLRRHPVSCFVAPLWRAMDHAQFSVHAYSSAREVDEITERLKKLADGWRDVADVDDDALAQRIVDDGIDVLVDLSGHTAGHRLGVFARKPAPMQLTWLGYLSTTGLPTIDGRICDRWSDPVGEAERWQVETPMRLPNSQWCYEPQVPVPQVSASPRASNGYWTFGSFNQAPKLGPDVLQSWIAILRAFPDARLRVVGITAPAMHERIGATLAAGGIAADRVDILDRLDIDGYLRAFRDVDVALDSFPYNGGTTTCDALLMGVPVVAVEGSRPVARSGVSLLNTIGLADWIARSPEDLPQLLRRQLADADRIAKLRAELPERMRASPLMDAPRFARDFEKLLRDAWTSH
ncbi:MAG TPA: tetratricopeptide repeat protein [Nevskiaceae bacterium]|nr:tetratricopeptide repeat protein [Nevskiaceae bacterium]